MKQGNSAQTNSLLFILFFVIVAIVIELFGIPEPLQSIERMIFLVTILVCAIIGLSFEDV